MLPAFSDIAGDVDVGFPKCDDLRSWIVLPVANRIYASAPRGISLFNLIRLDGPSHCSIRYILCSRSIRVRS